MDSAIEDCVVNTQIEAKMRKEIEESGLGKIFKIKSITGNLELGRFLGKRVRYKRHLREEAMSKGIGLIRVTEIFHIKEVQKNYKGEDCLRGYATSYKDTFGMCISMEDIEIVE